MPVALDPAAPRLTVQYGSFTIDETNGCRLSSEYDSDDTGVFGSFYVEFRVRLTQPSGDLPTDDAAFAVLIASAETNLRIPRQRLMVKLAGVFLRDWDFAPGALEQQTAILIEPELRLIEENCRDYRYGFRVRCQFPGNVPGNVFRRESLTQIGESLRERRTCTITATWTSSTHETAYQRYLDSADAFYTAYLPANVTDQHGTVGVWVEADATPARNDENSLVTATRVYWEVFAGRRESTVLTITKIDGRRICTIPSVWSATSFTALQNYLDNGGAFFTSVLPSTSGEWVLVDEEPGYNDQNGILNVTRVYHETAGGLREYTVRVTTNEFGGRQVVVSGTYYTTTLTAKQNYTAGISTLVTAAISAEGITQYESHSVPKVTGYDTTGLRYFFTWTINELPYPQGPGGFDDSNVLLESLDLRVLKPFGPQSVTGANAVTRLKTVVAKFVAWIDMQSVSGNDPVALWVSKFRAHTVTAVTSRLGADVTSVQVVEEEVGPGLHANQLVGTLRLIVTGGSVLSLNLKQSLIQIPSRDFAGRGDGTPFSYFPYRALAEKLLHREGTVEYIVGGTPPVLFGVGDNVVSGFAFVDTGKTAQESIDDQNAAGTLSLNSWFIDRRASPPYAAIDAPTSRGDDDISPYRTVVHAQIENWRFVAALEPGDTL